MKLYTINATPWSDKKSYGDNFVLLEDYPRSVAKVLSLYGVDGFTMYQVKGYWKGKEEASYKIEIATDKSYDVILDIAKILKIGYEQESVMITLPTNEVKFI